MVALFARLKIRLVRNRLRRQRSALVAVVLGALATVPLVVSAVLLFGLVRSDRAVGDPLVLSVFVLTWLGWTFLPIFAFGTDDTLDPQKLSFLPLRRRQLVTGLLVAACIGVPPIAMLLALGGSLWVYGRSIVTLPLALAAVVLHLLVCVASSRLVTTMLSNVLRTRRGRDAVVVVSSLLGLTFFGLQSLTTRLLASPAGPEQADAVFAILDVVKATPPGAAAATLFAAGDGDVVLTTVRLLIGVAWLAVLLFAWGIVLERAMVPKPIGSKVSRAAMPLFRGPLRLLPRNRSGAIAARDLRYAARDPHRRAQLLSPLLIAIVGPFRQALLADDPDLAVTVMTTSLAFLGGMTTLNQLGFEGGARWTQLVAPGGVRDDVVGRNIAATLISGTLAAVGGVAAAAYTGGWAILVPALVLGAAVVLVELAVGNLVSARFAMALPDPQTNLWGAAGGGRGCLTALGQLAGLLGQIVALSPAIVLVVLLWRRTGPMTLWFTAPVALAYAVVLWRAAATVAVRWITDREPELVAAVSPRAG